MWQFNYLSASRTRDVRDHLRLNKLQQAVLQSTLQLIYGKINELLFTRPQLSYLILWWSHWNAVKKFMFQWHLQVRDQILKCSIMFALLTHDMTTLYTVQLTSKHSSERTWGVFPERNWNKT